ncbi:hypothetical protein [Vibrio campbellii]
MQKSLPLHGLSMGELPLAGRPISNNARMLFALASGIPLSMFT